MLDRASAVPLHLQMEAVLREKLKNGEWGPGQAIPSENEMSRLFGVSRMTVRNVVTRLVLEGLLDRIPGKGTFVKAPKIIATSLSYAGIREQLEQMGYEVSTRLLSFEKRAARPSVARCFNLPEGALFYVIRRLRIVKEAPLSIHTSYIPVDLCPALESASLESEQLCNLLNATYGLAPARTEETLESIAATKEEAALLGVKPGHPLLLLEDKIFSEGGQVYEYARVVFRGDKIQIHLSF